MFPTSKSGILILELALFLMGILGGYIMGFAAGCRAGAEDARNAEQEEVDK